jgi:hypothetical protein
MVPIFVTKGFSQDGERLLGNDKDLIRDMAFLLVGM